jgi:hypothetical protein
MSDFHPGFHFQLTIISDSGIICDKGPNGIGGRGVKYQQDKYAEDYSEGDHVAVKRGEQFISAAILLTVCCYLLALLVVFKFYVLVIVHLTMVSNSFNKRTPLCGVRLSGLGRRVFLLLSS